MANWEKITLEVANNYGNLTKKGALLLTVAALCNGATSKKIAAQIPDRFDMGTNFIGDNMVNRLLGLTARYPDRVTALITHDLRSFKIDSIPDLLTDIRIDAIA